MKNIKYKNMTLRRFNGVDHGVDIFFMENPELFFSDINPNNNVIENS